MQILPEPLCECVYMGVVYDVCVFVCVCFDQNPKMCNFQTIKKQCCSKMRFKSVVVAIIIWFSTRDIVNCSGRIIAYTSEQQFSQQAIFDRQQADNKV